MKLYSIIRIFFGILIVYSSYQTCNTGLLQKGRILQDTSNSQEISVDDKLENLKNQQIPHGIVNKNLTEDLKNAEIFITMEMNYLSDPNPFVYKYGPNIQSYIISLESNFTSNNLIENLSKPSSFKDIISNYNFTLYSPWVRKAPSKQDDQSYVDICRVYSFEPITRLWTPYYKAEVTKETDDNAVVFTVKDFGQYGVSCDRVAPNQKLSAAYLNRSIIVSIVLIVILF